MREAKQKLTLSVESGIVDQAKRLGVNISELTEQVLGGYAVKDDGLDWKSYKDEYMTFLRTMDPLLARYSASVVVGDLFAKPGEKDTSFESEIRYHGTGGFSIDWADEIMTLDELDSPHHSLGFRNPGNVLQHLVKELEDAKIRRKEQVANLRIASRIVDAIYQADSMACRKKGVGPASGPEKVSRKGSRSKRNK